MKRLPPIFAAVLIVGCGAADDIGTSVQFCQSQCPDAVTLTPRDGAWAFSAVANGGAIWVVAGNAPASLVRASGALSVESVSGDNALLRAVAPGHGVVTLDYGSKGRAGLGYEVENVGSVGIYWFAYPDVVEPSIWAGAELDVGPLLSSAAGELLVDDTVGMVGQGVTPKSIYPGGPLGYTFRGDIAGTYQVSIVDGSTSFGNKALRVVSAVDSIERVGGG